MKSSFSGSGACVDVEHTPAGTVHVRHSRHLGGTVLVFTRAEWEVFLAGVRNGEFNFGRST